MGKIVDHENCEIYFNEEGYIVDDEDGSAETFKYCVYDRIKLTIVIEYAAKNAKEATEMFDNNGFKESTHFLFTYVNTQASRRTQKQTC